ncbi:MAG TPA: pentapeptide repeat-containing protein [Blastocatellia bacterium]|nr:pentapeptide repeat-containing protein [Blastocatellia bacterium]
MTDALPISTPPQTGCQYALRATHPCKHPVERDGLCIFHVPKLTSVEKNGLAKDARSEVDALENRFRSAFGQLLKQLEADPQIDTCEFSWFEFPRINFDRRLFKKKIDLYSSKFKQGASFVNTVFEHEADFSSCSIQGESSFRGATFQEPSSFAMVRFDQTGFDKAKFCRGVDFAQATFAGKTTFYETIFGDPSMMQENDKSEFKSTVFKNEANFYKAHFNTKTNFEDATFEEEAAFAASDFEEDANFKKAAFNTKAVFLKFSFKKAVDFTWATFGADVLVSGVSFKEFVNFNGVTLAQRTSFEANDEGSFESGCSFRWLKIPANALVTFENLNLEQASFVDSDLTRILFRDVKWYQPPFNWTRWHRRRVALWDEYRDKSDERRGYEKIAENYHQLVLNYESRRDYNTAEDFHIGEMETQRKKKGAGLKPGWRRRVKERINPYGIYWLFSNYGSSYWQAFIVLLAMLLTFSLIFLYSGFQPSKESAGSPAMMIEYNLVPDAQHHPVGFGQWIDDYARAILFSLSIITFQRERFYEPVGDWSRFWLFLSVLLLTTQAAMVLLAIRRRFKR